MGEVKKYRVWLPDGYGAGKWAEVVELNDYATLESELATVKKVAYGNMELLEENAKLRAELERTATWIEDLPVPTVGAAGQLVRIDKVLAAAPSAVVSSETVQDVNQQLLEALEAVKRLPYQMLFNAMADAVRITCGGSAVSVSVKGFKASIEAAIAAARKGEWE